MEDQFFDQTEKIASPQVPCRARRGGRPPKNGISPSTYKMATDKSFKPDAYLLYVLYSDGYRRYFRNTQVTLNHWNQAQKKHTKDPLPNPVIPRPGMYAKLWIQFSFPWCVDTNNNKTSSEKNASSDTERALVYKLDTVPVEQIDESNKAAIVGYEDIMDNLPKYTGQPDQSYTASYQGQKDIPNPEPVLFDLELPSGQLVPYYDFWGNFKPPPSPPSQQQPATPKRVSVLKLPKLPQAPPIIPVPFDVGALLNPNDLALVVYQPPMELGPDDEIPAPPPLPAPPVAPPLPQGPPPAPALPDNRSIMERMYEEVVLIRQAVERLQRVGGGGGGGGGSGGGYHNSFSSYDGPVISTKEAQAQQQESGMASVVEDMKNLNEGITADDDEDTRNKKRKLNREKYKKPSDSSKLKAMIEAAKLAKGDPEKKKKWAVVQVSGKSK